MLRPRGLIQHLARLNTCGVTCSLLLGTDGRLLGQSTDKPAADLGSLSAVGEIAAFAFREYAAAAAAEDASGRQRLEALLLETEVPGGACGAWPDPHAPHTPASLAAPLQTQRIGVTAVVGGPLLPTRFLLVCLGAVGGLAPRDLHRVLATGRQCLTDPLAHVAPPELAAAAVAQVAGAPEGWEPRADDAGTGGVIGVLGTTSMPTTGN